MHTPTTNWNIEKEEQTRALERDIATWQRESTSYFLSQISKRKRLLAKNRISLSGSRYCDNPSKQSTVKKKGRIQEFLSSLREEGHTEIQNYDYLEFGKYPPSTILSLNKLNETIIHLRRITMKIIKM